MIPSFSQFLPCLLLSAVQLVAALPWLWVVDPKLFKSLLGKVSGLAVYAGLILGLGLVGMLFLGFLKGSSSLELYGRGYASILHIQIVDDLFIGAFQLMSLVWPKGGAVALAAFREGIRQPMFWLIALF